MSDHRDLERRVEQLEQEFAQVRRFRPRGIRFRSSLALGNIPLLAIASGPDPDCGELRGHARGLIAIGDVATGVVALGGLARGVVAFGGLSLGAVAFGGLSIGVVVAVGGLALGSLAFGGGAVGGVAIGGGAVGYYACGGGAVGPHAVSPLWQDPEGLAFFRQYGLAATCDGRRQPRLSSLEVSLASLPASAFSAVVQSRRTVTGESHE
jgi:hypothetical protein